MKKFEVRMLLAILVLLVSRVNASCLCPEMNAGSGIPLKPLFYQFRSGSFDSAIDVVKETIESYNDLSRSEDNYVKIVILEEFVTTRSAQAMNSMQGMTTVNNDSYKFRIAAIHKSGTYRPELFEMEISQGRVLPVQQPVSKNGGSKEVSANTSRLHFNLSKMQNWSVLTKSGKDLLAMVMGLSHGSKKRLTKKGSEATKLDDYIEANAKFIEKLSTMNKQEKEGTLRLEKVNRMATVDNLTVHIYQFSPRVVNFWRSYRLDWEVCNTIEIWINIIIRFSKGGPTVIADGSNQIDPLFSKSGQYCYAKKPVFKVVQRKVLPIVVPKPKQKAPKSVFEAYPEVREILKKRKKTIVVVKPKVVPAKPVEQKLVEPVVKNVEQPILKPVEQKLEEPVQETKKQIVEEVVQPIPEIIEQTIEKVEQAWEKQPVVKQDEDVITELEPNEVPQKLEDDLANDVVETVREVTQEEFNSIMNFGTDNDLAYYTKMIQFETGSVNPYDEVKKELINILKLSIWRLTPVEDDTVTIVFQGSINKEKKIDITVDKLQGKLAEIFETEMKRDAGLMTDEERLKLHLDPKEQNVVYIYRIMKRIKHVWNRAIVAGGEDYQTACGFNKMTLIIYSDGTYWASNLEALKKLFITMQIGFKAMFGTTLLGQMAINVDVKDQTGKVLKQEQKALTLAITLKQIDVNLMLMKFMYLAQSDGMLEEHFCQLLLTLFQGWSAQIPELTNKKYAAPDLAGRNCPNLNSGLQSLQISFLSRRILV